MEKKIVVGTSGYSYKDWVGPLYPPGTKQRDFLSVYARHFEMTELNFTYYRQPDAATVSRMADSTPAGFLFTVKAHCSLTHSVDRSNFLQEADTFVRGIEPLLEHGKLASVLFQFPYSYHYNSENRLYLDTVCSGFKGYPIAIEFRNNEWMRPAVFKEFKDRAITLVNVDVPPLKNLPQSSGEVTSGTGYLRFHGRNAKNWWSGDNVTRYDYLYTDNELLERLGDIKKMVQRAGIVLVVFNNHSKGQAVVNANRLKELIKNDSLPG
ncbi:DUF72 domain-containing protein [Chitinispirillales bacterium ANBcel5]|uniref:DUF72 domain-containing protein n=1 Tax=Cellulosispirillum alkaliphilum TaxID=3039283 RepID=UPI002A55170A|nr:DUF72 domain-containing protein [Chitinispirillales bacterium ANBcel5]